MSNPWLKSFKKPQKYTTYYKWSSKSRVHEMDLWPRLKTIRTLANKSPPLCTGTTDKRLGDPNLKDRGEVGYRRKAVSAARLQGYPSITRE